jgi:hypothetical protein
VYFLVIATKIRIKLEREREKLEIRWSGGRYADGWSF